MKTITLSKGPTGWNSATTVDNGTPDGDLIRLFGTHIIPTAFTAEADPETVLKEISEMNPDCTVKLAEPV